ncbi:MAG: hypothetical protein P4M07_10000 [Xanthobacteraceae bacterium]|nr:hypothetical protein [Xanthobacteraceae bacterium]
MLAGGARADEQPWRTWHLGALTFDAPQALHLATDLQQKLVLFDPNDQEWGLKLEDQPSPRAMVANIGYGVNVLPDASGTAALGRTAITFGGHAATRTDWRDDDVHWRGFDVVVRGLGRGAALLKFECHSPVETWATAQPACERIAASVQLTAAATNPPPAEPPTPPPAPPAAPPPPVKPPVAAPPAIPPTMPPVATPPAPPPGAIKPAAPPPPAHVTPPATPPVEIKPPAPTPPQAPAESATWRIGALVVLGAAILGGIVLLVRRRQTPAAAAATPPVGQRFCTQCGARILTAGPCPKCGAVE